MNELILNKEDYDKIERIQKTSYFADCLKQKMIFEIVHYRCEKCNSALIEVQLAKDNFEEMSDGQMSDHEAGFNREFYCPKCKTTFLRDIEVYSIEDEIDMPSPSQLEALEKGRRTGWNNRGIRGFIAEMWFANKLRNEGYKIAKTMYYDYEIDASIFNEKGVGRLLQKYSKKNKVMKLLKSFGKGYPDLICLKDKKISFCEIKSNDSKIKEHQKQVMETLESKGYEVKTIRLNVKFNVEENDIK
ncbi:VRR-NUC domain-containing protein [Candidatus Pacearchaeota archaeon]|nr:VRR-NUC domain-containing protein [Candidatus Pacearchaeota archaeon]